MAAANNVTLVSEAPSVHTARLFLSTEWRDLLMLNYAIDPALARPFVPHGTELDSFDGKTYVSLVGLRFARTKIFGSFSIPFHANFDEINLRIYVRRVGNGEARRGVMFIREVVSLPAVTFIARLVYRENYMSLPLTHSIAMDSKGGSIEYRWNSKEHSFRLYAKTVGDPANPKEGSVEQFITEHYWGYTPQPDGSALEYCVSHDPWRIWRADEARFEGDAAHLYGADFGRVLARPPESALIADGSPVLIYRGRRIE
jgi:uncharacterized protein YqjF (DUF2071 family)